MANPWTGEVAIVIDGVSQDCKLTLGALAESAPDPLGGVQQFPVASESFWFGGKSAAVTAIAS